jgi:hypothetical protein
MSLIDGQTMMKYSKFILNEIKPRADKLNKSLADFIPSAGALHLFMLEQEGKTHRKQTREFLDYVMNPTETPTDVIVLITDSLILHSIILMNKEKELQ